MYLKECWKNVLGNLPDAIAALIATDEFLQWQLRPANVFVIQQVVETVLLWI
jgi:hypothetical protein